MASFLINPGKRILKDATPPIVYRGLSRVWAAWRRNRHSDQAWGLRPPEWYDNVYNSSEDYNSHYSLSRYYFLWTVIADRIRNSNVCTILDLGCGPGQFAALLRDRGVPRYRGLDFSPRCIAMAKRACPEYDFELTDILNSNALRNGQYDCVIALEFLEHIEDDCGLLAAIRSGTRVIASVPNFPDTAHVRHFAGESEVRQRYDSCLTSCRVDPFVADAAGRTYFLVEGTRI